MEVGIVGFGSYIPKDNKNLVDQDTATIAVCAAQKAFLKSGINSKKIGAIYVGSESHPYATKPTATIVGDALSVGQDFFAADVQFACKGGTAAIQICYGLIKAGMIDYGLAIGADVAQARPGDVLEKYVGAGGAAFILGNKKDEIIATIDETISITTNTPDFWRRSLQKYPEHTNRFTGEPSYFRHTISAAEKILKKTGLSVKDFDHVVFHQPNLKFPKVTAKRLGFSKQQIETGLLVEKIGNCYSASSLLGLSSVLDTAKSGQKILLVSYGSGSGSDAFVLTVSLC